MLLAGFLDTLHSCMLLVLLLLLLLVLSLVHPFVISQQAPQLPFCVLNPAANN